MRGINFNMIEYVYCGVNKNMEIQWVKGSSSKTRYFKTPGYLRKAVSYHNKYYSNDLWQIIAFKLDPAINGVVIE